MEKTTIQINLETLERLKALKIFERQSYDDLLNNLINNIEEEKLSEDEIEEIKKGLDNIKRGKVYSIESVAKELVISLNQRFQIEITETAKKFLNKLSKNDAENILKKIYSIRENPFRYLKRLQGEKLWRLRIADYRAVMDVIVSMNKIVIIRIGHRKNVYDQFSNTSIFNSTIVPGLRCSSISLGITIMA